MKFLRSLLLVSLLSARALLAADAPAAPSPEAAIEEARTLAATLKYQQGTVTLAEGLAKITLPEKYRYLNAADAETVLSKFWGNPHGAGTLGMIVPAGFDPMISAGWAAVLSFDDGGYVKDDDAAKINYNDMIKDMKEDVAAGNKERVKEGYEAIELVGWAEPPRYDAATHKLYWAKELRFGANNEHTLNYNIRMLGRRGVLVVNAVASMDELKDVQAATPALLAMVNFQEGHRYTDFNDDTDKVATYGIAALIAGGVAAKAGFFKLLWVGVLAFKKVIIIALVVIGGWFKKMWDGIRQRKAVAISPSANPPPSA